MTARYDTRVCRTRPFDADAHDAPRTNDRLIRVRQAIDAAVTFKRAQRAEREALEQSPAGREELQVRVRA
jgi:hypothetical protein